MFGQSYQPTDGLPSPTGTQQPRTIPRPDGLSDGWDLRRSEAYCQALTRREAKNFYWGFIALPRPRRVAIYALYSFARQVDDAVDLRMACGGALAGDPLAPHRARLDACFAGHVADPVMHVLSEVIRRYGLPHEELEGLIDGVALDLRVTRYATWEELRRYCELVAATVGRMCVRIFGYDDPIALEQAVELGVAMQLANALRDVREDFQRGRVYLPQEDLARFGLSDDDLVSEGPPDGWDALLHFEASRAREAFAAGLHVQEHIPRRAAACVLTMAGLYQAILDRLEREPELPLRRRLSLDSRQKLAVMGRAWARVI
ncbi:MAG TPA: squalene/phytoene synthase family protein [Thermomicrobiaceae bacterium]|nr:squalene/phytoene synthase family protein [Thermomicrobiaceae bacterium]